VCVCVVKVEEKWRAREMDLQRQERGISKEVHAN
jgi:hypothetical protein